METIHDFLAVHAKQKPDDIAFTFIEDDGEKSQICFNELHQKAQSIAQHLRLEYEAEMRVVLLFPPGLEYIQAFIGCLYAGVVAVPLYPPQSKKHAGRVLTVIDDCEANLVLTNSALKSQLETSLSPLPIVSFNQLIEATPLSSGIDDISLPTADQIAFLQYTSGSTGTPKGVVVSHSNIIANLKTLEEATSCSSVDVFCNWLPLFHDLGLVNTLLLPIYLGAHSVLMSPVRFIKRPLVWLKAITEYKASICGAPNFAFDHCLERIKPHQLVGINLSSWRVAFNAAEPVDAETLMRFSDRFARVGFKESAIFPAYGMAEATVFICGGSHATAYTAQPFSIDALQKGQAIHSDDSENQQVLIGHGNVQSHHHLKVVSPELLQELPDGKVGEIWFSGPSVAQGYWNDPEKTKACFGAHLEGELNKYLRTGDLGFKHEGELYISGRIKDVIIIKGRNYYPQDFEKLAYSVCIGLNQNGAAAFEVNGKAVLLLEVNRSMQKEFDFKLASETIKTAIFEQFEVLLEDIIFLRAARLNKTSSGKIQRSLVKKRYLSDDIEFLYSGSKGPSDGNETKDHSPLSAEKALSSTTKLEAQLCDLWQDILGIESIGVEENFLMLGGHSLMAARLISQIRKQFNVDVKIKTFFTAPTIRELAKVINQSASTRIPKIIPVTTEESLPLSFAQQRLWLIDQIDQQKSQYNMCKGIRIEGALDEVALTLAFQTIIERHYILRTNIRKTNSGEAIQVVQTAFNFSISKFTLTSLNEEEQETAIRAHLDDEFSTPFDLSKDIMLRVKLLSCAANTSVLIVCMHHIAVDGWSEGIIVNELNILYRYFLNNEAVQDENFPLIKLEIQYSDYAHWQRNWLQGDVLESQLKFWKNRLKNLPEVHNLAFDRPRPPVQNYEGAHYIQMLSVDIQIGLNTIAREHDTTLFGVLQIAFAILLERHSNKGEGNTDAENIVIGTPVANREQAELSPLVGFFVNSLILQTNLSGNPRFDALLQNSKANLLDAYDHSQLPFEKLVDEMKHERTLGYSPLFQVKLALQNNDAGEFELPGLSCAWLERSHSVALHDLSLDVHEVSKHGNSQGLKLDWEFAVSLFDATTIERMAKHFEVLLKGIIENPQAKLNDLPFLTSTEVEQLLDWSHWPSVERCEKIAETGLVLRQNETNTVLDLFEQQVANNPEQVAAMFNESAVNSERLSYKELNAKANQVAQYLIEQGVNPDTLVALCVERSLEMVIGILGILKAGAAYVPIDPNYPEKHIEHILDDSEVEIVLTSAELLSELPFDELQILPLDDEMWDSFLGDYSEDNIEREKISVSSSSLAYIIYTSGSTGLPKGVAIEHGSLLQSTLSRYEVYQESPSSFALFSSFAFDSSVVGIFWTLVSGGKLCILDIKQGVDLDAFQTILIEEKVSHFLTLPSVYSGILLANIKPSSSFKTVIVAGEVCDKNLVKQHQSSDWKQCRLVNEYGPTEACVWSSYYDCTEHSDGIIPIGRSVPHVDLFVLDRELRLCPLGVTGELYIGGKNIARGYLNAPELTSHKFIESPFDASQRLYKTGDLVRCMPDENGLPGNMAFLGRLDNQIKIRGFRIELGEIEGAIAEYEQVTEAVVLAKSLDPEQNTKQLVAYVVPNKNVSEVSNYEVVFREALQDHLQKLLLSHKIPSVIVMLEQLPLTPNGKVDRKALEAKEVSSQLMQEYIAPESEIEKQLCDLWQSLLKLKKVGITENFFAIGGDSILAIQAVTQAAKEGLVITTRQLFKCQTIEKLALEVNSQIQVLAPQDSISGEHFLIPIQREFLSTDSTDQHHYNQSVLLTVPENFSLDALVKIVSAIYQRHDILRLSIKSDKATYVPLTNQFSERAVQCWDLGKLKGEMWESELARLGHEAKAGLSLADGDLFRAVLFEGQTDQRRLLLTLHHMAVDGVSWRILLQDMETAFTQWQQQQTIELSPKTSSFQQWGEYLLDYANSDALNLEESFWLAQASEPVAALPKDREISQNDNCISDAKIVSFKLGKKQTDALLNDCSLAYRTQINDLLLSALYLALQEWSGQKIFRIDLESHGREPLTETLDLTQTLGWFTSVFPVTLALQSEASIGEVIKTVKEQLREIPDNGIGFGLLKYKTQEETSNNDFAQLIGNTSEILFNYLGQFDQIVNQDSAFKLAYEAAGEDVSIARQRTHMLEFNGMVTAGQLGFSLRFNGLQHDQETMESVLKGVVSALDQIIEHCQSKNTGGVTPSDFPLCLANQAQLDEWYHFYPDVEKIYPTTGMQQGLLFHSGLDNSAYLTQLSVDLDGLLNTSMMKQAWQEVVSRHDVFRTLFSDDHSHQLVLPEVQLPFIKLDWSEYSEKEQQQQLIRFLEKDRTQGFNLSQAPLMRITLIVFSRQQHRLIWTNHHALSDGWSLPLVLKDVMSLYKQAHIRSKNSALSDNLSASALLPTLPKPQPYEDYIGWLQKRDQEQARSYWRDLLADIEKPTQIIVHHTAKDQLQTGQPRKTKQQKLTLSEEKSAQLESLAKQHHVTLNTLIQAAWAYLLHCYSGDQLVVFGETVSGRPPEINGVENMVGLFINSLPVPVKIEPEQEIGTWLRALHEDSIDRNEYGFLSLSEIQHLSSLANSSSGERNLFDSLVVFENYPVDQEIQKIITGSGLNVVDIHNEEQTNYALTLMVLPERTELNGKLSFELGYHSGGFEDVTITRILGHLEKVLIELLGSHLKTVGELSILSEHEVHQLLVDWNDTAKDYPQDKCMHELFERQVEINPEAVAVIFDNERMTYTQLNQKANQLARYLMKQGITPDSLVGVCVERSFEMLVSVLAIMKSGGAYLPLDPGYPKVRLAYMLEDSGVQWVISQKHLKEKCPVQQLICLDDQNLSDTLSILESSNVDNIGLTSNHLAYLIYTSGSTGKPKGVMLEHHNLTNFLCSMQTEPAMSHEDTLLAVTSLSFDIHTLELYLPLIVGGCVVIASSEDVLSPDVLVDLINEHKVTTMQATPATWKMLVNNDWQPSRKIKALCGGEALSYELKESLVKCEAVELWNMYGPTETAVWSATQEINDVVTLGTPIANTQFYVLDAQLKLVPVGVGGELHIGGDGVARGYLNQSRLTDEKFISNPFSDMPDARLYKTGDLVRWLSDGTLEYISRIDQQVKIRGYRIELGEIESQLNQYPGIKDCVVVASGEETDKQLVAFYLTTDTKVIDKNKLHDEELMAYLQQSLPEYMLPAAFICLETIPLTPNGKVDRRALEQLDVNFASKQTYLAPRNVMEEQLIAIWAEVLSLEPTQIGVNDSFFELGGHSLLVARVVSKIRSQFSVDLSINVIFKQDSIADLAEVIANTERSEIPAILPINRAELDSQNGHQLPLSYVQERLWFIDQLEPNNPSYNIPGAVSIIGELDIEHLEQAFNLIISRHENLRTIFPNQDGQAQQVILKSLDFKLESVDLTDFQNDEIRHQQAKERCQTEAATSFDLANGPLIRGMLIKLTTQEHIVMLNMHHIITDEVSMALLIKELGVIMECLREGRNPGQSLDLPILPIQYLDFSIWQRRLLEDGGVLNQQLSYWQDKLAGVPESLNLATDYPRPTIQDSSGATSQIFRLDTQLTSQLKDLAEQQGCTLYMTLLAAFKVLLFRYTGQEDICLGSPIANRQYEETKDLIGMFVNTIALRSLVEGDVSFSDLLTQVKKTCLEAYEHQDAPFEKVVDLVQPERNTSISALFQIMFILHNDPMDSSEQNIQPYPLEYNFSRFDQIIHLTESAEGLEGFIGYRTALYKPETIERMTQHFIALCRAITTEPTAKISHLSFIDEVEKQQLLIEYNKTQGEYPKDKCIHQIFIEQVVNNPDKTALVQVGSSGSAGEAGSELLSYQQLYDKSFELALYLQSLGVKPDSLVGLCVGRSMEMMLGILGILQAGGAYVPMDPDYPDDRLAYMLEDSQTSIVLTLGVFKDKLKALVNKDTQIIVLDEAGGIPTDFISKLNDKELELTNEVKPDHLAYVIYTSGSTGQPKGVMIEHRMVVDYCFSVFKKMGLQNCETFASVSTFSADLGNIALYVPIMFNKTIYLFSNHYVNHPIKLKHYLDNYPIDCMKITPSHFEMFKISDTEIVAPSKVLIFAGEPLTKKIVETVNNLNPDCKVFNNYGPTETTISKLSTNELVSSDISNIYLGKPLNNTQVYILDTHNQPQPIGVPGELHIAGDGVARGYLNRPELTDEKFIPNTFNPGTRLYKSGDLARWLDDGNIEYLGRIDTQVKIRGFRIELGEIEARINQCEEIENCVVIVQGEAANKKLVAFYGAVNPVDGCSEKSNTLNEKLKGHLLQTLPEYMIPTTFVCLEVIPLMLNGKVDRRALELIDVSFESNQTYLAPRNDMERQLVIIWAEVLNLDPDKIGVNDNFFELGGHSLLAVSLVSKIDSQLELDLPLYALFDLPTISDTAVILNAANDQLEELWDEDDMGVEFEEGTL